MLLGFGSGVYQLHFVLAVIQGLRIDERYQDHEE
jgi:hypothetical protein